MNSFYLTQHFKKKKINLILLLIPGIVSGYSGLFVNNFNLLICFYVGFATSFVVIRITFYARLKSFKISSQRKLFQHMVRMEIPSQILITRIKFQASQCESLSSNSKPEFDSVSLSSTH